MGTPYQTNCSIARPDPIFLTPFSDRRDLEEGKGRIFRRVREAVERYGYSQREVAEYLGVHYSSVSRMLRKGND
jgi:predicted XRE-type DNA-binding protein